MIKPFLYSVLISLSLILSPLAADFNYDTKTSTLNIDGQLLSGEYFTKFVPIILSVPDSDTITISMHSPGGSFYDAVLMGDTIHGTDVKFVARDQCLSACAYIWLAADRKAVDYANVDIVYVAIHMPAYLGVTMPADQTTPKLVQDVKDYLDRIGLPSAMKEDILNTPNSSKLFLDRKYMEKYGYNIEAMDTVP